MFTETNPCMRSSAWRQDGSKNSIINLTSCMTLLYGYRCSHFVFTFYIWLTNQGGLFPGDFFIIITRLKLVQK